MKLGAVATGNSFFNRDNELKELLERFQDDHIVMSGPRRLGKSSILKKLTEMVSEYQYDAVIIDLQGENPSAEGFVNCLEKTFPQEAKSQTFLQKLSVLNPKKHLKKGGVKAMGVGADIEFTESKQVSWKENGDFCMARLSSQNVLILFDEFSVFLEKFIARNSEEAENFLGWLRSWRIKPDNQFRFLFTDSVGLQSLLEMHNLSPQMNDCFDYQLGPFKQSHARAMLKKFSLDKGWELQDTEANLLCNKAGWLSPFFLNLLLNESIRCANDRFYKSEQEGEIEEGAKKRLAANDIEDGYEKLLIARSRFNHWVSRLAKQFEDPNEIRGAQLILSAIADKNTGLSLPQIDIRLQQLFPDVKKREHSRQRIILLLQEHGYLAIPDSNGIIDFLSFPLKEYWRRNHLDIDV